MPAHGPHSAIIAKVPPPFSVLWQGRVGKATAPAATQIEADEPPSAYPTSRGSRASVGASDEHGGRSDARRVGGRGDGPAGLPTRKNTTQARAAADRFACVECTRSQLNRTHSTYDTTWILIVTLRFTSINMTTERAIRRDGSLAMTFYHEVAGLIPDSGGRAVYRVDVNITLGGAR